MKENGITSHLGRVIYNGDKDYRTFHAKWMGTCIVVNLVIGLMAIVSNNDNINDIYRAVSMVSLIYFLIVPGAGFKQAFKSEESLYLYLTPVKKSKILFSILGTWLKGFGLLILCRYTLGIGIATSTGSNINLEELIYLTDLGLILLIMLQMALVLSTLIMGVLAVDIICVVKKIPSYIALVVVFILGGIVYNLPDFLKYSALEGINTGQMIIDPMKIYLYPSYDYGSVVLGPSLVGFIVALGLFIYAISIFEGYTYDYKSQTIISLGKFRGGKLTTTNISIALGIILLLGIPYMSFMDFTKETPEKSFQIKQVIVLRDRITDVDNVRLSQSSGCDFDTGYLISPYTPVEDIKKATGISHEYVTGTSDGNYQLILVRDKEIMSYVVGYPEEDGITILADKKKFKDSIYKFTVNNEPIFKYIFEDGNIILKTEI
ncbi:MAG: hypothetical protein RR840_09660 [Clostridium sp.]